jgi:hypothetical protein
VVGDSTLTICRIELARIEAMIADYRNQNKITPIVLPLNESVEIAPDIKVTFLEMRSDNAIARLGLEVPRDVPVHRKEVLDAGTGPK